MRKFSLVLIFMCALMPAHSLLAQVSEKNVASKDTLNVSRDSIIQLIRMKDLLLNKIRHDSINMSNLIVSLEYNRDSLNAALNQSIYRQKLDSADRMRRYLNYRDYNRRSRQDLYNPIGIIDKDSIRSSMKEIVDLVFEDTAYTPRPQVLRSSMDRLVHHLANDSVYFRIVNANQDTIPFVLKKNKVDSTAFFVMNSKKDSAKLFMRSLDKNTLYMWVGDDLMLKHLLKKQGPPEGIDIQWQGPNQFRIPRRPVPVPVPKLWYLRSEPSLMVNQVAFANWAKGGNNNISFTSEVKAWANYAKGNIKWDNFYWFVYGVQKTELMNLRKSQDRISLVSNLSHKAFKNFDYTLGATFDTQGFKGFAYPNDSIPVSKFLSPADLKINLGMTYKPNPKLTVNVSPVTGMLRFVMDTVVIDQTKYGLKPDKRIMAQFGARVIVSHNMVLVKNVTMDNYLDLFSNYIDHPEKVNFDWRLSLNLRVNKYISTSIKTELMYDNKVLVPIYEVKDGTKVKIGEGKRIQFNEILGVTFRYIM
ncbi:MAG: DUF3078 domain-containing protein [Bacteroidales bacterium]